MIHYLKPWMYPVIASVEIVVSVLTTYFKSADDGYVVRDFPFISDTGNKGIAASVFSLLLSVYAFLIFINMYIRFEQVKWKYNWKEHRRIFIINIVSVLAGLLSCFGVLIACTFQIDTLEMAHNTGAVMAFAIGTFYFWMQTVISFICKELTGSRIVISVTRTVMSVLQTAFLIGTFAVTLQYKSTKDPSVKRNAAIQEWILAFLVTFYVLTFIPEFCQFDWTMQLISKHKSNKVSHETTVNTDTATQQENKKENGNI